MRKGKGHGANCVMQGKRKLLTVVSCCVLSDQFLRIITIMGNPTKERWPTIEQMPDYKHLNSMLRQEKCVVGLS